ncbi:MAG: hypothetical protein HKN87_04520 [Saprospiraceae bacterium]|nr:hypothetical protein [Saprospiraceae bacterium]
MRISIHADPNIHITRLEYIVLYLNHHPYAQNNVSFTINQQTADVHLHYGNPIVNAENPSLHATIPTQNWLLAESDTNQSFWALYANQYDFEEMQVYSVETSKKRPQSIIENNKYGFDLFETLFFHLTRFEEAYAQKDQQDRHGYLLEDHHFLIRHGLHRSPVVDHLVETLLRSIGINIHHCGQRTLSHDLDAIWKYPNLLKGIKAFLKTAAAPTRDPTVSKVLQQYLKVKNKTLPDPYDTFDWLLSTPNHFDKYLFIMAGGQTKYEGHYNLTSNKLNEIVKTADGSGYTLGLHPSYAAYTDIEKLSTEKKELEKYLNAEIRDSRQHWLHFDVLETPLLLEHVGISFDHTIGYQNKVGFRSGTGFSYPWYNLKEERTLNLWEKPFALMDTALVSETKGHADRMHEIVREVIDTIGKKTDFTFNFHNSSFDPLRLGGPELLKIYEQFIKEKTRSLS